VTIYLITYALYFAILGIGLARQNTRRWIIAASTPMFALVLLRGNVGVDLPMYVQSIELIQLANGYTFLFEPGFELLILGLSSIASDPATVAKMIATLTTVFLLLGKWRTKTAYQVLGLGIIPYFYLDMTMNGLRYGLAFAIALLSLHGLMATQRIRYTLSALAAASMQISSLYLTGLLQTLLKPSRKYILLVLPIIAIIALIGTDYLLQKATANVGLSKPGMTAGIAPLLLSIIVLIGCWKDKFISSNYRIALLILLALTMATYGITQFSYAGLRFQQLNYFLILLFVIYTSENSGRARSKNLLLTLILVSILSTAFRLNNFYSEAGNGDAPFAPYKFFWQE